jgi:hypothetical protein
MHHVGVFDALEDEQCMFTPLGYDGSPNRIDALVWGATELMLGEPPAADTGENASVPRRDALTEDDDERDNDDNW